MQTKDNTKNKVLNMYFLLFGILSFFVATAVFGSIVGGYIDDKYDLAPYGSLLSLLVSYALSIFSVAFYIKKRYNRSVS